MNDYRLTTALKNRSKNNYLSIKDMKQIEKRQKLAVLYQAKEKFEEYQNDVFEIIDNDGLKNDDDKRRIDTALKVLPFIIPQKKAIEMTVTSKSIEDIIKMDIQEAEVIETKTENTENKQKDDNK